MNRLASSAVAIACGAVAACLYLTVVLGTPGALILVYLTQLPLFVAGLWLGTSTVAIAGLTSALVLLAFSDFLGAAVFAALNVVPVVLLVRQALLARRREDGTLAWYPPGLLTSWLTGFALFGIAAALVMNGGPQGLQEGLHDVVAPVLDRIAQRPLPNREVIAQTLSMVIPGMIAASWMLMAVVNAALAQGVLSRFGVNWRPSPHLAELSLPLWIPVVLGVAAAATVFGGMARFIGVNTMIALFVPFCLAGLAVLHTAARRLRNPVTALVAFYVMAVLFGWPFVVVAILGLLESGLGLRRRLAPRGVNIDG
jgi:hypothetical protein